jgi:hypothetical protein
VGVVAHICNPTTEKVETGGLRFEASPDKKLLRPPFQNKLGVLECL